MDYKYSVDGIGWDGSKVVNYARSKFQTDDITAEGVFMLLECIFTGQSPSQVLKLEGNIPIRTKDDMIKVKRIEPNAKFIKVTLFDDRIDYGTRNELIERYPALKWKESGIRKACNNLVSKYKECKFEYVERVS